MQFKGNQTLRFAEPDPLRIPGYNFQSQLLGWPLLQENPVMAFPVAQSQLYLLFLALLHPLFVVDANLLLPTSDLDTLSRLWTGFGFPTPLDISVSGNPCHEIAGIHCERRLSTESPPVLRVTRIVLDSRGLSGFLSRTIGSFPELKELSLSNNHLVGQIPPYIVDCQKLEVLNLRNNRFSGEVPSEISSLVRLRTLDLSLNRLSGDLSFLKFFPNLEYLSLADNLFSGRIPNSLRSFRNLGHLNLSGNNYIQGLVPSINQVGHPVSHRMKMKTRTSGVLPKRYILAENSNSTKNDHVGPIALAPSPKSSNAEAPSPSTSSATHKKNKGKKKLKGWAIGFFPGVAAGMISGLLGSFLFKMLLICIRGRGKDSGPLIFSSLIKKAENIAFLEKEDGLSSLEIIGRGGCGEVYKAELPGTGKVIAIKKILQPQPQPQQPPDATELVDEESKFLNKKLRQIQSEIRTVGQIRHRNLLPLLAYVPRPDCHLLVYEYMKNGSLLDVLNQVSEGTRELDWSMRHRIAVGIAAGLEYLHMHHSQKIIHRDLKPANILLDDDMEARIADFGLAKAVPDANTHVTTSNLAGTVGYIAPEYHQTLKFTDKCDIFSFGVVLAGLVMRKLPSDEFFQRTDEMNMAKWLRNVMTSDNPRRAIDEKLLGNGYEEQMLLVLKIACFCTVDDPKERPNSTDVRCMLSQIKP